MAGELRALYFAEGVSVSAASAAPAAAGGGGGVAWVAPDSAGAPEEEYNNARCFVFRKGINSPEIWADVRVPEGYQGGQQITLSLPWFSASTSSTVLMQATAYLVGSTSAFDSTTNSHVSTNTAQTNTTPSRLLRRASIDLTDATGLVNGVAVAAGDLLRVKVIRASSDSDTANVYVPKSPTATEVTFT